MCRIPGLSSVVMMPELLRRLDRDLERPGNAQSGVDRQTYEQRDESYYNRLTDTLHIDAYHTTPSRCPHSGQ